MNDFLATVKPPFEFLTQEHGYALVYEGVSDSFDNGQLIYESPRLRIQVTRDRSQVFVSVRARGDYRDYDEDILRLLLAGAAHYQSPIEEARFTVASRATFLRENLSAIERLFEPSHLKDTCLRGRSLKNERFRALFGKRAPL